VPKDGEEELRIIAAGFELSRATELARLLDLFLRQPERGHERSECAAIITSGGAVASP